MPRFSVIVPAPEVRAYPHECLASVRAGLVTVFTEPGGLPRRSRAAFCRRASARYRRHRMPGAPVPARARLRHTVVRLRHTAVTLRHTVVTLGLHRAYRSLRAAVRAGRRTHKAAVRSGRALRAAALRVRTEPVAPLFERRPGPSAATRSPLTTVPQPAGSGPVTERL